MNILGVLPGTSDLTNFTWFVVARAQLYSYGFFVMVLFGAIYAILPQLAGIAFPSARLVGAHFWLAAAGILFYTVPLAIGGVVEGFKLQDATVPFNQITKSTLPFLRVSTMGDAFLALGHALFLVNLAWLATRFYRPRLASAYESVTADIKTVEAQP